MRLLEIFRLVWLNIMENKFKMMLTSLGVIVGAATIVLVIAIGEGSQADVEEQFKNLNAGAIDISVGSGIDMGAMMQRQMQASGDMPFPGGSGGGNAPGGGGNRAIQGSGGLSGRAARNPMSLVQLSLEDVTDIQALIPGLRDVTLLQSSETAIFGGVLEEEKSVNLVGVYPAYRNVSNLTVAYGRFFEDEDDLAYYAVIGNALAEELFEYPPYALGDYLEIEDKTYEIIGVLEKMGAVSSGINPDQAVYLPYTTAQKYVFGRGGSPQIAAVAEKINDVPGIMEDMDSLLKENHPNAAFNIADAGNAKEVASNSANTLSLLLLAVASIVFIVGGIGIMNVMFVSVKERTGEIGILKAVGCSKKTILIEFLLEAGAISLLGGVVGVGAGFALMPLLEVFGMRAERSAGGILLAMGFALVTGTVFGFYPAWKASRLVPINALNE